jgi:hypothetical protein
MRELRSAYINMSGGRLKVRVEHLDDCMIIFSVNSNRDKPNNVEPGLSELGVVK